MLRRLLAGIRALFRTFVSYWKAGAESRSLFRDESLSHYLL